MNKLNGIKIAAGAIALLSIAAATVDSAFAQDNPKPAAPTEQMSGCSCCKKMMEKKMNDNQNKMPGMNHPVPSGK
mgnify:CR=1 FL=1